MRTVLDRRWPSGAFDDHLRLGRDRLSEVAGRQVERWKPGPQAGCHPGPRRGTDDHVCTAGVEPGLGECGDHAGVVGGSHDPAGTQHHPDRRHDLSVSPKIRSRILLGVEGLSWRETVSPNETTSGLADGRQHVLSEHARDLVFCLV